MSAGLFTCLCCGFRPLEEQPPGTFDICAVCGWEDDDVQARDPNFEGGANQSSLREAQGLWLKSVNAGASSVDKFWKAYQKDSTWKPL